MLKKERLEIGKTGEIKKKSLEVEPSKELDSLLEKVEKKEIYLSKPVTDDQTGQVLVTAPSAKQQKVVLPLDKQQMAYGLKQKVDDAIRWLAEWCLKLIKMNPQGVILQQAQDDRTSNQSTN
jgi:hypothetical protein